MSVVAGIDEAGYGPMLGPLVVSAVAFRLDDERAQGDLWEVLSDGVARGRTPGGERAAVADSKTLKRGNDIGPLEESVLSFLRVGRLPCSALRGMMASLGAARDEEWDAYPWYRGRDVALPRETDPARVEQLAARLRDALERQGVAFCGAWCEPMDVREFNRVVNEYGNKSWTTATRVMGLLEGLWEAYGAEGLHVAVDKQGGRNRYDGWLRQSFWGCRVRAAREGAAASAYEVTGAGRRMSVVFEAQADVRHFAVSLASMVSKYVRELFMGMLNAYWCERVPGLRPTAGYVTDGRRFLADIEREVEAEPSLAAMLVRER